MGLMEHHRRNIIDRPVPSSAPIMNGKGPSQPDWMNKFTKKKISPSPTASGQQSQGRNAPERRGITPSSSFKRGESEKPAQPEWMKKFEKIGQKTEEGTNGTSSSQHNRSSSPSRKQRANHAVMPTAPTTPSWMKQYKKAPSVAGTPSVPSLPMMPPIEQPSSTQTTSRDREKRRNSEDKDKKKTKKGWGALLKSKTASNGDSGSPPKKVM